MIKSNVMGKKLLAQVSGGSVGYLAAVTVATACHKNVQGRDVNRIRSATVRALGQDDSCVNPDDGSDRLLK